MKLNIHHLKYKDLPQIIRGHGIVNQPIASKKIGAKSLHSGITFMPPRTAVPVHSHNAEEQVTILEGTMKIILDGDQEVFCSQYDSTFIAAGVTHELINETDEPVLAMVIYGSSNVTRTFTKTGEIVDIGSSDDKFTGARGA
jgi:quercetin dioxygenase-like cupin family protein